MEVAPKNDINRHISQEILRQLIQKKSFLLKSLVLKNHLKKCQRCSEIVNIKNYLQQIAGRTKPVESESHPDTSDLDDSIARIYDSSLSKQEAADFLHHISSCSQCFEYVSFVLEDSLTPVPEEIEQQIAALTDISLAAIVLKESPPQESIFQKILSKIKKSVEKIKKAVLPPFSQPQPGSVWAIRAGIPITLVAAIALAIFLLPTEPSAYVYDDKVPFDYNASSFRGTTGTLDDPEYRTLREQFLFAISDYMTRDYENVILRLENVEPTANSLRAKSPQKEQLAIIHNFLFYLGVSHFALSRSESRELSNEQKAEHNEKATQYLLEAKSLAMESNLEMIDRDTYFLGLAYGLGGQRDLSIQQLKKIRLESKYFKKGIELSEKWSGEFQ